METSSYSQTPFAFHKKRMRLMKKMKQSFMRFFDNPLTKCIIPKLILYLDWLFQAIH